LYQNGTLVEQWTFNFANATAEERAKVRVRNSAFFDDQIEVDVELGPVPDSDGRDKDVTVAFKMFDGFDPKGEYWTDANGLEMQERHITTIPTNYTFLNDKPYPNYKTVSGNYLPVVTGIMMRDHNNSGVSVVVLNDRAQGGSADLGDKGTIELMQARRMLHDDGKGLGEPLNETERADWKPPRITARYYIQMFNTKSAPSKMR